MAHRIPPITDVEPPEAPVTVVGDVHLCEEQPEVTERFLAWLEKTSGETATLVLLGDLFEQWMGRPMQHDALPRRVLDALRLVAAAGTRLTFMAGNRDFLFRGVDGVEIEIWPDPVRMRLGGKTVVLTHGDQLCTADHGYQAMRKLFHGPWGWMFEHLVPFPVKRYVGDGVRSVSMRETNRKPRADMGIDYGEALSWMDAYEADAIVAGHVHTGVAHRHAGPPEREILVLKDWERGGGIITFDGQELRLVPPVGP